MPASSSVTVPLFTVLVNGAAIEPSEANSLLEITISDFLRLPDVCTVAIGYTGTPDTDPFQQLDASSFKVGQELEVKMGSTDEHTTKTLFKGEIVTLEPVFESGNVAMVVRAYDRSHRMLRARKLRAFNQQAVIPGHTLRLYAHDRVCESERCQLIV